MTRVYIHEHFNRFYGWVAPPGCGEGEFFVRVRRREPQLDGDLRSIRSGGDLGFLYHSCHDLNRSNAKMMKPKKKDGLPEEATS